MCDVCILISRVGPVKGPQVFASVAVHSVGEFDTSLCEVGCEAASPRRVATSQALQCTRFVMVMDRTDRYMARLQSGKVV